MDSSKNNSLNGGNSAPTTSTSVLSPNGNSRPLTTTPSTTMSVSDENSSYSGSPLKTAPATPTTPTKMTTAMTAITASSFADNRTTAKFVGSGGGGKTKKKRKTPTDVNAPKKPVSAYITYLNERRETVKSENPTMTYPDILKKLAAEWSSLLPEDRKKYHEEANRAREKYNQEISEYKTTDNYKKFCEEQKEEQQQRLQTQFAPQASANAPRFSQIPVNSSAQNNAASPQKHIPKPQPQSQQQPQQQPQHPNTQQQQSTQMARQQFQMQGGAPVSRTSQVQTLHQGQYSQQKVQQAPPSIMHQQLQQQQPQIQQHQQQSTVQQQQQQQQQFQQRQPTQNLEPGIAPGDFKREMSTESPSSRPSPVRPPLRMPSNTPMSPNNLTPPPGIASPNYNPLGQQHLYQRYQQQSPVTPNASAPMPSFPVATTPNPTMPIHQLNSQTAASVAQEGMLKRQASSVSTSRQNSLQTYDIPIFTDEFLEHNKAREAELRQLKKHNGQLEEQNAMLSKHVENMKAAIGKLDNDALHQRTHNRSLQQQLDNLRLNLSTHLGSLPLPGSKDPPNSDNIDDYMNSVYRMMTESPKPENQHFINLFKETIWSLDFSQTPM